MNRDSESGPNPGGMAEPPRDKGFRSRKREDHALLMIEELRANLHDLARVKHILLELGRFYDPVMGGAIVEIEQQKRIMALIEEGRRAEAEALIKSRYDIYIEGRAHLGRREDG